MEGEAGGARWKKLGYVLALLLIGATGLVGFSTGLEATNTTDFCTSCHSMQGNLEEYKQTIHFKNAAGVQAGCPDCHVPRATVPKLMAKLYAAKDVYHEIAGTIDTKEKFEARRWQMANAVWDRMKATNSRECRNCHDFTFMDLDSQSSSAAKKHVRAEASGKTCIDCHKGIAHTEPDPPEEAASPTQDQEGSET